MKRPCPAHEDFREWCIGCNATNWDYSSPQMHKRWAKAWKQAAKHLYKAVSLDNAVLRTENAALKAKIEALPGLLVELKISGQEIDCIKVHFGEGK